MKTIYIGDIHGCLDELKGLVDKVRPESGDKLISLGDFLDKGPDGVGCIQFARQIGMAAVLGNHEDWHLRRRKHELKALADPHYVSPMKAATKDTSDTSRMTEADWAWLAGLPRFRRDNGYVAVHGGIRPGFTPEKHDKGEMLRLRWIDADGKHVPVDYDNLDAPMKPGVTHWTDRYDGRDHVVYGHEAHTLSRPSVIKTARGARCFGIDTGVVHGGHLTALVVEEDGSYRFEQVRSRKTYKVPLSAIPWD